MPRIRTIKPEFWSDEKLSQLVAIDRLVFLGLIGMADDYGRLHDNIKVIDAFVFPNSSETVRESVANLSRIGRVRRGNCSNGAKVIEIVNWSKHQRVDKPQNHLALPKITTYTDENTGNNAIPELVANHSGTVREKVATLPGTVGHRERTSEAALSLSEEVPLGTAIGSTLSRMEATMTAQLEKQKKQKTQIEKPNEVEEHAWIDWLAARKAKNLGPVTGSVLKRVKSEADKLGWTIGEAIEYAASKSQGGFEADWVNNNRTNGHHVPSQQTNGKTKLESVMEKVRATLGVQE